MTDTAHLTEAERQGAADSTLDADTARRAADHMAACNTCAADVARLKTLMTRVRSAPTRAPDDDVAELWPSIRSRIEQSKVVELPAARPAAPSHRRRWIAAGFAVAAGLLLFAYVRPVGEPLVISDPVDLPVSAVSVADSSQLYEEQARTLLNMLEMQRSMLRPNTTASIDRDLLVIDKSIAELKDALVRDPNNPALRILLAASYRQKIGLLTRARNAG